METAASVDAVPVGLRSSVLVALCAAVSFAVAFGVIVAGAWPAWVAGRAYLPWAVKPWEVCSVWGCGVGLVLFWARREAAGPAALLSGVAFFGGLFGATVLEILVHGTGT